MLDRRRFITSAAVAAVAPPVLADTFDPVPGLVAECNRVYAAWMAVEDEKDPEYNRLFARWCDLKAEIATTPATSRQGVLVQAEYTEELLREDLESSSAAIPLDRPIMKTLVEAIRLQLT